MPDFDLERKICSDSITLIAGIDEVGRGSLAGPIVACAVVFEDYDRLEAVLSEIKDSKKLTVKKREKLSELILETASDYSYGQIEASEIDLIGIAEANQKIFEIARDKLKKCDHALLDGLKGKNRQIKASFYVGGDSLSTSIAAASILAKVHRDNLMIDFSQKYPEYGFEKNKGYGSQYHIDAIKKHGPSPIHRASFLRGILQKDNPTLL